MRIPVRINYEEMTDAEFRTHVLREVDQIKEVQAAHGENLKELLAILRASEIGAALFKWIIGMGLTAIGIWSYLHGQK